MTPKLRFKDVNGSNFPPYSKVIFGDIFTEINQKTSDTNKYPLYSLTIEDGVTEKTERYERSFLVTKDGDNYKIAPPNAFVYNPMNLRFGALGVNHSNKQVAVSQYYNIFTLSDNTVLKYWEDYLVSKPMLDYYFSIATGSLIEKLRVHYSSFVKICKLVPSFKEQQKIADFLTAYDEKVSLQQQKVEALEKRKKGLLQKVFSQEIRFKADDGSEFPGWEEKNLSDVCAYTTLQGEGFACDYVGTENLLKDFAGVSFNIDDISSIKGVKYVVGDILIGNIRPYLHKTWLADRCGVCSTDVLVIRHSNIYPGFLFRLISNNAFFEYVMQSAKGSKMPRGDKAFIMAKPIEVPCKLEQQKIADFFSAIDEQIGLEKQRLEAMQTIKKGLLQQMFCDGSEAEEEEPAGAAAIYQLHPQASTLQAAAPAAEYNK